MTQCRFNVGRTRYVLMHMGQEQKFIPPPTTPNTLVSVLQVPKLFSAVRNVLPQVWNEQILLSKMRRIITSLTARGRYLNLHCVMVNSCAMSNKRDHRQVPQVSLTECLL